MDCPADDPRPSARVGAGNHLRADQRTAVRRPAAEAVQLLLGWRAGHPNPVQPTVTLVDQLRTILATREGARNCGYRKQRRSPSWAAAAAEVEHAAVLQQFLVLLLVCRRRSRTASDRPSGNASPTSNGSRLLSADRSDA